MKDKHHGGLLLAGRYNLNDGNEKFLSPAVDLIMSVGLSHGAVSPQMFYENLLWIFRFASDQAWR